MDPILVKALRQMLQAQQRAKQAGTPLSPYDLDAFVREETGGKHGLDDAKQLLTSINTDVGPRNLARSAVQGATFDWGDELLGKLPEAIGGGEGAKEEMRLRQDLFRQQHPVADGVAGLAGGVASGMLIPGGEAATLTRAIGRGALTGAAMGGVAGAGRAEGSLTDRLPGAATGAAVGGVLGAAVPAVVGGYKALQPAAVAARRIGHAVEKSGGVDGVGAAATDMDLAGRGKQVMLGDLSDRLRLETDFAANNNDDILSQLAPEVIARNREGSARLLGDARTVLGDNPRAGARLRDLKATTRQVGKDVYNPLRENNTQIQLDPETAATLKDPVVASALKDAQTTGMIGPDKDLGTPSFAHLHDVKQSLDDAIAKAFKDGAGNRADRLKDARDVIVKQLGKVAGYDAASMKYAVAKADEKALVAGTKAWDVEDTDELAHAMASMSKEAQDQFRYGLASKMLTRLKSVKTNRDAANEIINSSIATNEKLEVAFGGKDNLARYMARVKQEGNLAKMKGVFGNSATQRRAQAAGFDPLEMGVTLAEGAATKGVSIVGKGFQKVLGGRQREIARHVGEAMMTKGTDNIFDYLHGLDNPDPVLGKLAGTALPAGLGGLLKF